MRELTQTFSFVFLRDGEDLPSGVTVEGEIGQRLRFPDLTTDYDGIYICEASNPYGTASTSIHRFGYMGMFCCVMALESVGVKLPIKVTLSFLAI